MNAPVLNLMIAGAMPSASTQMAHIPAAVRLVTRHLPSFSKWGSHWCSLEKINDETSYIVKG